MRRRVLGLVVLLLAASLAGCTGQPDGSASRDSYQLVHVRGNETHEPPSGDVCDVGFDHAIDREEQRLVYGHRYDLEDPGFVLAFDHFEASSDCPIQYSLHAGFDPVFVSMGELGNLTVEPGEEEVAFETSQRTFALAPGESEQIRYEGTFERGSGEQVEVEGQLVAEHLGSFPTDGLEAE